MPLIADIYRAIFKKDYSFVWQQFARGKSGTYTPVPDDKVQYTYKGFLISFDSYTHYVSAGDKTYGSIYTRGVAAFTSSSDFTLSISQQGVPDNIGEVFNQHDIQTGNKAFDKRFIIKSNDEAKLLLLLVSRSITSSLQDMKTIRLEITDGDGLFGEKPLKGNFMLYYVMAGKVKEISQLVKLHQLFAKLLDGLVKICAIQSGHTEK